MNNEQPTIPINPLGSSRVAGRLIFRLPVNYLLRRILAVIRQIACLLYCEGTPLHTGPVLIGSDRIFNLRGAEPQAKRTVISNEESVYPVEIMEDGVLVALIDGLTTSELPMAGKGVLTAISHGTSPLRVTTYRRCLCGDPENYEESDNPIGGNLV